MALHFHQAIQTKWLAPTNTKPSRVKASCRDGNLTLSWDYGLDQGENHARVAMALVRKLGWTPDKGKYPVYWHAGAAHPIPNGYVFVGGGDVVQHDYTAIDRELTDISGVDHA